MNDKFFVKYNQVVELFELGTYEDEQWRMQLATLLTELADLWPNIDFEDLELQLNDYLWRIKQIHMWAGLDINSILDELDAHGSLYFMDAKKYLNPEEIDDILEKFWEISGDSNLPKSGTIYRLAIGKLKKLEQIKKNKSQKSKLELLIQKLNKFEKHKWDVLLNLASDWESEERFLRIVKDLTKINSKIKKSDFNYFVDYLVYLIEKDYIQEIVSDNKAELTKKLLFDDLIKELKEYAKKP